MWTKVRFGGGQLGFWGVTRAPPTHLSPPCSGGGSRVRPVHGGSGRPTHLGQVDFGAAGGEPGAGARPRRLPPHRGGGPLCWPPRGAPDPTAGRRDPPGSGSGAPRGAGQGEARGRPPEKQRGIKGCCDGEGVSCFEGSGGAWGGPGAEQCPGGLFGGGSWGGFGGPKGGLCVLCAAPQNPVVPGGGFGGAQGALGGSRVPLSSWGVPSECGGGLL